MITKTICSTVATTQPNLPTLGMLPIHRHPIYYHTPWCEMLGCCGTDKNVLHLFYPLIMVHTEIDMLTSTLGRHRSDENAMHKQDLIELSKDDLVQFLSFARTAMENVFRVLEKRTKGMQVAYLFDEGHPSVTIPVITTHTYTWKGAKCGSAVRNEDKDTSMHPTGYKEMDGYAWDFPDSDVTLYTLTEDVGEGTNLYFYGGSTQPDTFLLYDTLAIDTDTETKTITSGVEYKKGQWVECDGKVYIATADGTSDDFSDLDEQPADFRHSIHYIMQWPPSLNEAVIPALDQAVFDAIKYYIIAEWLHSAYPDEEQGYLARYNNAMEGVKHYCSMLNKVIIDRIPRPF